MSRTYSAAYNRKTNSVSADEAPLILLEINHPEFDVPARVVNDTADLTSNGNLFIACAFSITLPDDTDGQMPRAQLAIDNVGAILTKPIDDSNGASGATVTVMQVMRSAPNTVEWQAILDLRNIEMTRFQVTAELGYEDVLNRPAVTKRHDPFTSPGMF